VSVRSSLSLDNFNLYANRRPDINKSMYTYLTPPLFKNLSNDIKLTFMLKLSRGGVGGKGPPNAHPSPTAC